MNNHNQTPNENIENIINNYDTDKNNHQEKLINKDINIDIDTEKKKNLLNNKTEKEIKKEMLFNNNIFGNKKCLKFKKVKLLLLIQFNLILSYFILFYIILFFYYFI